MNNITKKTKIILFAGLIVAIILPFSNMEMVDAIKQQGAAAIDKATKKINEKKDDKKDDKAKNKKSKLKSKEYTYEKKSNYVKKMDLHNYKADEILKEMSSLMIQSMPNDDGTKKQDSMSESKRDKIKALQKKLDKVTKEHKEKIIDKDLRKELKKTRQLIIDSGIPTTVLATGIDHLYIQLSKENARYEEEILELVKDIPYLLEYGEGFKRLACVSTDSDCNYEIGGIKIQIKQFPFLDATCSLSIPMKKDGVDGFLTAAHCFNGYSEDVYQPDTSSENYLLGHSNSTWRSFEDNGECDCAWIKDTSSTAQISGVYAYENAYWPTFDTHVPSVGEPAMLRGVFNNNGEYNWAHNIQYNDVVISDLFGLGKTTVNLMSFTSPAEPGDSGGSAYYGNTYIGIVVGSGLIDGTIQTIFVPWDHVTENISGLELTPHP